MIPIRCARLPACCLALLCCLPGGRLWAHRVDIFAAVEGDGVIAGEAYFSGGGRPAGASVLLLRDGEECARTTTDAGGRFRFTGIAAGDYEVVIELADGHRASCRIPAERFGGEAETAPDAGASADPAGGPAPPDPAPTDDGESARLAAQVRALRADVQALEHRIRLQDVLGGLGYILGLTGLWCLLRSRRQG